MIMMLSVSLAGCSSIEDGLNAIKTDGDQNHSLYRIQKTISGAIWIITGRSKSSRNIPLHMISTIDTIYESAGDFSEGLAAVQKDGKWGYIDKTGKMTIEPQWESAHAFVNGLAMVVEKVSSEDKFGYIDTAGKYIWQPTN